MKKSHTYMLFITFKSHKITKIISKYRSIYVKEYMYVKNKILCKIKLYKIRYF